MSVDVIRGHMLRCLRESYDLSLLDGATAAGCSVVRLSDMERSRVDPDDSEWTRTIGAICAAGQLRRGSRKDCR